MSRHVFGLPALGGGTVSAEMVAWHVRPGEMVAEDQPLVEMSTDKAVVEVPSPVGGRLLSVAGHPGDAVAVGAELAVFDTAAQSAADGDGAGVQAAANAPPASRPSGQERAAAAGPDAQARAATPAQLASGASPAPPQKLQVASGASQALPQKSQLASGAPPAPPHELQVVSGISPVLSGKSGVSSGSSPLAPRARIMASPATRRRAKEAGIDLAMVAGSGPGGRILAADLAVATGAAAVPGAARAAAAAVATDSRMRTGTEASAGEIADADAADGVTEIPLIGIRRVIAQRMSEAMRQAPHFSYVEEIDVTALEALRLHLNSRLRPGEAPYTYLPFIIAALVPVLAEFPQCNAHYDAARNLILRHRAVHVGIATQTPDGLKVPVVRDVGRLRLRELAAAIRRVSEAARSGQARRDELTGSTITITSLGKLGGIVATPILNLPEVAIVGVNKATERPVVVDGQVAIRRIMNLSSSFDHRFVDGFDAAAMIQALKARLEQPATLFID